MMLKVYEAGMLLAHWHGCVVGDRLGGSGSSRQQRLRSLPPKNLRQLHANSDGRQQWQSGDRPHPGIIRARQLRSQ